MVGVIDIGSNTVKVSFFRQDRNGVFSLYLKQSTRVGLLRYRNDNRLSREGMTVLSNTVSEYRKLASALECSHLFALATAGLRGIANAEEVVSFVKTAAGIDIVILSGEEEADLCFKGLCHAVGKPHDGVLIDMGGASTEVVLIRDGINVRRVSLSFGALYLFDRFVAGDLPRRSEIDAISSWVKKTVLKELDGFPHELSHAYLSGGTAKAISSILCPSVKVGCHSAFQAESFDHLLNSFMADDPEFLHHAVVSLGDRYHLTVPALAALTVLFCCLAIHAVVPVDAGIREGQLFEIEHGSADKTL